MMNKLNILIDGLQDLLSDSVSQFDVSRRMYDLNLHEGYENTAVKSHFIEKLRGIYSTYIADNNEAILKVDKLKGDTERAYYKFLDLQEKLAEATKELYDLGEEI